MLTVSAKRYQVPVKLKHHRYVIDIVSDETQSLCDFLETYCPDKKPLLLTNSVVGPLLMPKLLKSFKKQGFKPEYLILPDGERHKNLATVQHGYDWLTEQGANRHSVMLLFGGGVLGDIGGFIAATYMRGIKYVQIPTTLVSQVDSSVGGKVGVDHQEGKNLVGAFYQPLHVHIDVSYLNTLPEREYLCGLAEVIKYAVIKDTKFYEFLQKERIGILQRDPVLLEKIVKKCCTIKAGVVTRDEKETRGERMILNFGHTVGHAIEKLTDYRKYGHGEGVAMGMVQAAELSVAEGHCTREIALDITDILAAYGLPVKLPNFSKRQWEQSLKHDKKMRGSHLQFVFVESIGQVSVASITPQKVAQFLRR